MGRKSLPISVEIPVISERTIMGDKDKAFGNFLRALAEIADNKPQGPIDLTIKYCEALATLLENDPSAAKLVVACTGPIIELIKTRAKKMGL